VLDPFASSTLPVLEQVLQFTQARHGVLAGNIANLNTPGYKSRDLSTEAFKESLRDAITSSRRSRSPGDAVVLGPLATGSDEGLMTLNSLGGGNEGTLPSMKEAMNTLVYHDQRDVSLESQVTEISKNQAQHNLAVTLMTAQFRLMRSAISETVA
jgi:flagellar basal-body rod protein FlgB